MDYAVEILLAVNTGLVSLAVWFLYCILRDVNSLKVFAGVAQEKFSAQEERIKILELHRRRS